MGVLICLCQGGLRSPSASSWAFMKSHCICCELWMALYHLVSSAKWNPVYCIHILPTAIFHLDLSRCPLLHKRLQPPCIMDCKGNDTTWELRMPFFRTRSHIYRVTSSTHKAFHKYEHILRPYFNLQQIAIPHSLSSPIHSPFIVWTPFIILTIWLLWN